MTQLISATELSNHLNDYIILDCRSDLAGPKKAYQLFNEGHIPNARQAHLEDDLSGTIIAGTTGRHPLPSAASFEQTLQRWGIQQDSNVVVYDQNNSMFAARAWWLLKWAGIQSVKVLNGGLQQWSAIGGEIESHTHPATTSTFKIAPHDEWLVAAEDLKQQPRNTALLDARALERYRGDVEPLDPKAGHIPSARNADFTKNLTDCGIFKSQAELQQRFAELIDCDVICYCGSGVTACHNILAITEAGMPMPKLYPGSWSEWVTRPENQIATGIEGEIL